MEEEEREDPVIRMALELRTVMWRLGHWREQVAAGENLHQIQKEMKKDRVRIKALLHDLAAERVIALQPLDEDLQARGVTYKRP